MKSGIIIEFRARKKLMFDFMDMHDVANNLILLTLAMLLPP